jgi:hypothetical protein
MAKPAYVAIVQVLINPDTSGVVNESSACDWFSGLLSENGQVLDWAYLSVGGKLMTPTEKIIPDNYEEGDFLS